MRVERLGRRHIGQWEFGQRQSAVEESTRSRGIDNEPRRDGKPFAFDGNSAVLLPGAFQPDFIQVIDPSPLSFTNEERIDIRPIPMRIGDGIPRARRHQQLVVALRLTPGLVMIKSEAALESASQLGVGFPPRPPLTQRQESRQVVTGRQLFEQKVRQRRGRLADGESRMFAALQQDDRFAQAPRDHGEQRTGKARPDDGDIVIRPHRHAPHSIGARTVCWRFICSNRAARASKHASHLEKRRKSHRSAKTRPFASPIP